MPSGSFLDLAEAACRSAQMDPSDTTGDLALAKAAVNTVYLKVCHSGDPWDFLEREGQWLTTGGSDTYGYDSIATAMSVTGATIRDIIGLTIDSVDGPPLPSTDWMGLEYDASGSQGSSEGTGVPYKWGKWASRIRLYPNPDQAYTIGTYCILTPDELSGDSDMPLIPLAWSRSVIVPGAAALLLENEGGSEAGADYQRRMARHDEAVAGMRTALAAAKRPTFNAVAPGAFDHLPGSGSDWSYY